MIFLYDRYYSNSIGVRFSLAHFFEALYYRGTVPVDYYYRYLLTNNVNNM